MAAIARLPENGQIRLHRKQAEVFYDRHRFRVVVAGRRWGKTVLAMSTLVEAARKSRSKVWYIAPSYRMAKQIMWEELKLFVPPELILKVHETELSMKLINGSVIELKGADKPDTLRGIGLAYVVLDEFQDMKEEVWEKVIRPTLASTRGKALFIGTPKGYANLYNVYLNGRDGKKKRTWASWQFPTITSPFIPESEILAARADMDPKSFRQEFEASFETMSGRVYHQFDRNVHLGEYPFNPHLPIWVGVDFNIDPMSAVILQPQPSGEVWAVDEIYQYSSNTESLCEELERRYWRFKKQMVIYPDPAGGNRQHARGESDLDIFREKNFKRIKFRRKHPAVADRVNSMNKMFMDASGAVKMRVNLPCKNLANSLEQTLYKEGSRDIDKRPGVEHITDACGYPIELEFPMRKIEIRGISL